MHPRHSQSFYKLGGVLLDIVISGWRKPVSIKSHGQFRSASASPSSSSVLTAATGAPESAGTGLLPRFSSTAKENHWQRVDTQQRISPQKSLWILRWINLGFLRTVIVERSSCVAAAGMDALQNRADH
ncbi:hypothetical protein Q8A73_017608 [Channa argus]|nr:hypothetical protein Q8A73_017608 [Channa argus]